MNNEDFVRALARDRESREFHAREETLRDILAEHERATCGVHELHRIHAARRRTVDLIEEVYRTPTEEQER